MHVRTNSYKEKVISFFCVTKCAAGRKLAAPTIIRPMKKSPRLNKFQEGFVLNLSLKKFVWLNNFWLKKKTAYLLFVKKSSWLGFDLFMWSH